MNAARTSKSILSHPRYAAGDVLGRGAQGVVVRVADREAPELALVAKIYEPGAFSEESLRGEFALLARVAAPGLVRAHDLARDPSSGALFLVEDFIDGADIGDAVREGSRHAAQRLLMRTLADVAQTLAALHDAGFVHGDLKPAHVRVPRAGGRAMVLDLGAAITHQSGAVAGFTPAFAAPEVVAGQAPSPLADLYSLAALLWFAAVGAPPGPPPRARLRERAPWIAPSVAELLEAMLASHPRDRPESANDVLARIGAAAKRGGSAAAPAPPPPPAPIGREREIVELARDLLGGRPSVRYLAGPSGIGKSHLARELATRALLDGGGARRLVFPDVGGAVSARLVAFFRGAAEAFPFEAGDARFLLVLDDLERAPAELVAALDAYRCRDATPLANMSILATTREPPAGAPRLDLAPLDDAGFAALCRAVGKVDARDIASAARASGKNPGFLVASVGRVPLTRDTAIERAKHLSETAREMLAMIALAGGSAPASFLDLATAGSASKKIAELLETSLVDRRRAGEAISYTLGSTAFGRDLGAALGSCSVADRAADAMLADEGSANATSLLALATSSFPPKRRADLLGLAARVARRDGLRSEEIDALLGLAADPPRRTADLLARLERLTRDAGTTAAHPQVLEWLDDASKMSPPLVPLALRRRAEKAARDGNAARAEELAGEALAVARASADPANEGFSLATLGLVALYRAEWEAADRSLSLARSRLSTVDSPDAEEVARLEHNAGVVALYRGRVGDAIDAFDRSLATKRRLGDRAGMRSCLLNLGLALAKAGRLDDAQRALEEAERLARSLGQTAGLGWCLAAHADVEVRRKRPREAERLVAEAESLRDALPAAVRADLFVLRAQVALLEGRGDAALDHLAAIDRSVRDKDPLIDARAKIAEASAHLARLPADPRKAARLAIAAARFSRASALPEAVAEALDVLRAARRSRAPVGYPSPMAASPPPDDAMWAWIAAFASSDDVDAAALDLARIVIREAGGERAIVAELDQAGTPLRAWGVDLDGLPIASARERIDVELAKSAVSSDAPIYQRDVVTAGGRGARLAASRMRAIVVVEHRFVPGRFDSVSNARASQWATLALLLLKSPPPRASDVAAETLARVDVLTIARPESRTFVTTAVPTHEARRAFPTLLGQSAAMKRAQARLDLAIDSDLPVLIQGETGTGKELFARALHDHGARAKNPFVALNCGAVPDTLFEAELFGHARGSFTGAERARPGLIAKAEGGTLFLDEIGELPLAKQAVLLRALELRRYRAVGSDEEKPFDVRIVSATNRDLEASVEERSFRRDLLYRLNAITIPIPPLRERFGDVAILAKKFLEKSGSTATLTPAALAALDAFSWPGNVRELEHQIQRVIALKVAKVDVDHLPRSIRSAPLSKPPSASAEPDDRDEIRRALASTNGNISRAAERLGLTRHGLKKKMVRLGLRAPAGAKET